MFKRHWSATIFLTVLLPAVAPAQVDTTTTTTPIDDQTSVGIGTPTATDGALGSSNPLASSVGLANAGIWQNTIRDWHSTDWQMSYMGTNAVTGALEPRVAKFQEIGGGINYIGDNGIWTRSVDLVELMPDSLGGAAALKQ